jgi:hypothetical protein
VAVFFAAAVGGVNGLVNRQNNVGHCNFGGFFGQGVAAAGAASGLDQLVTTQFAKQLFEVRQGYFLALTDSGQGDWARMLAQGQVNHGSNCKSTFGGETHDKILGC